MKINRIVKGTKVIAEDVKVLETVSSKMRGLMFSRKPANNQAFVFVNKEESRQESSLHMLFVFYRIDVAWLDKGFEIVDLREGLVPFTPLIIPRKAAKYVIEMKAGKIKENKLEIGDKLKFL